MEPWLTRAARVHGARTALKTTDGAETTYAELHQRANAVAAALQARRVAPGDHVALALAGPDLVVALHACLLLGVVAVPIDLRLTEAEQALRTAHASLILDALPTIDGPGSQSPARGPRAIDPDTTATLMFTSGTTAGPKPVALSHDNWLWNALGSALALGLDPDETWLCPMPLAHVGGLSIQIRSAVYGTTVLLHERYDTERVLNALMDPRQRVTLISLVPTMLARLLDAGLQQPPTLRRVLLGGGPIAPALLARAREARVNVSPSYGMTEACSQIATDGVPLLGTELEIAPDGEILVRGRTVAAGALGPDGWLHTGDLGAFDDGGRLVIAGRKADTIVSGGENVAPAEVESVLLEHPGVVDAAVFGRADPEWGEAVVAQVVLADGTEIGAEALRIHCAERLAAFKVPKRFEPVSGVPRGVTGKLLRRELR
ncbi:MAG TPA: AMP-binding protein [Solirubrobacteraceae bacterium]|jgi:O-succinylbenzoic acid--CoA ligase|nr:AMP-binding protein [Solirubrobacteraceae bacterium]